MRPPRTAGPKGFTLLELMIASAVLLIAITGMLFTFVNCMLLNDLNGEMVTAANDAQYVMEQIKGLAYGSIDSYVPVQLANLAGESIPSPTIAQVSPAVKEITVNVIWTDTRGRQRNFSLSTRIRRP